VILFVVFGCIYGYWQYSSYSDGKNASWMDLGTPATSFSELHLFDAGLQDRGVDIYVRDDGNQIFMSPHDDPANWVEVEEGPRFRDYYFVEDCSTDFPKLAAQSPSYPDQEIADCKRYVWNWETIRDETYALLTEDGSIFTWRYSPSLGRLFRSSIEGIGLGILVSLLLLFVQRYQERRSNILSQ
jgi:hypothetical protein